MRYRNAANNNDSGNCIVFYEIYVYCKCRAKNKVDFHDLSSRGLLKDHFIFGNPNLP